MKQQTHQWFLAPLLSFIAGIIVQVLSCSWILTIGIIGVVCCGFYSFSILRNTRPLDPSASSGRAGLKLDEKIIEQKLIPICQDKLKFQDKWDVKSLTLSLSKGAYEVTNTTTHLTIPLLLFLLGISQTTIQQKRFSHITQNYTCKELSLTGIVTDKNPGPIKFQSQITVTIPYFQNLPWAGSLFSLQCIVPTFKKITVGDTITLSPLTIAKPHTDKRLSKQRSFDDFLIKEGILAYVFVPKTTTISISQPTTSLRRFLWEKKQALYTKIRTLLSFQANLFYELIFLGNKTHVRPDEMGNNFNIWGISHILARSGLHIALLIIMWQWLFSLVPIPLIIKNFLLIIFALIYHLLSWSSISFLRALLFFLLLQQGKLFKQRITTSHLFIMVCFLVLFFNPYQLFSLDFQLSFGLTYALIAFCLPKPS